MLEISNKPLTIGSGVNSSYITKNGNEEEYFRAMSDQEVDDFSEGKY